jgi:hypothetical protein
MNKSTKSGIRFAIAIFLVAFAFGSLQLALATVQKDARVTQVFHDVRLLASHAAPRSATVNDNVHAGTAVRTGSDSRAELTFTDQTITRLGANSVFGFGEGGKTYDLGSGAILMYAPKEAGTVKINTAVATAAVSGFTMIYEFHNTTWNKCVLIEGDGTVTLTRYPNQSRNLHSGQLLVFRPDATTLPEPEDFDVCKLIQKSRLITQFGKLPSWDLMLSICQRLQTSPINGKLVDPTNVDALDQNSAAHPHPPPPPPQGSPVSELRRR